MAQAVEVQHAEEFALPRGDRRVQRFNHWQLIHRNRDDGVQLQPRHASC